MVTSLYAQLADKEEACRLLQTRLSELQDILLLRFLHILRQPINYFYRFFNHLPALPNQLRRSATSAFSCIKRFFFEKPDAETLRCRPAGGAASGSTRAKHTVVS